MPRHLIDREGKVWTYPAVDLGAAIGYPDPDFDAWSYSVRNLGAVEIVVENGETVISLRAATAHAQAVRAAEAFLATIEEGSVRLRYEIGSWIEETCETPRDAIGRMAGALADAGESGRVVFAAKTRNLNALSEYRLNRIETPEERLSLIFKKWRLSQGRFDGDMASFLVRFGLLDRTVVVSESNNSGALVFEHWGVGFKAYDSFDKSWSFAAPGVPIAKQPDPEYGRWIDRAYRHVLNEGGPRFEYVDAVIQARQAEPYRSRYDRLLLPWQSGDGHRLITGTSFQMAPMEHTMAAQ